jgi:peptidoglycan hydrolase-like protein with peptidoglycan-binding domain
MVQAAPVSSFRSPVKNSAFWTIRENGVATQCRTQGLTFAILLQRAIRQLTPYHITIDGRPGPQTIRALIAWAFTQNVPQATMRNLNADLLSKTIGPETMRVMIKAVLAGNGRPNVALGDIDLARVMEPLPWSRSPPVPHRGATTLVCGPETQVAGPPSIATMRPGFNPRLRQMSPLPAAPTPTQQVQIVRTLQQQLQDLGYRISEVTGVPGTETQNAGAQLARDKRLTIPSNDVLALAAVVNREFARHFSA